MTNGNYHDPGYQQPPPQHAHQPPPHQPQPAHRPPPHHAPKPKSNMVPIIAVIVVVIVVLAGVFLFMGDGPAAGTLKDSSKRVNNMDWQGAAALTWPSLAGADVQQDIADELKDQADYVTSEITDIYDTIYMKDMSPNEQKDAQDTIKDIQDALREESVIVTVEDYCEVIFESTGTVVDRESDHYGDVGTGMSSIIMVKINGQWYMHLYYWLL